MRTSTSPYYVKLRLMLHLLLRASSSLHLSLGGKDVGVLTRLLLETKAASLVALKVPINFALDDFRSDVAPAVVEEHCDLRKMKLLIVSPPATR